nr:hypothetical protein [Algoriphagus locisalis]
MRIGRYELDLTALGNAGIKPFDFSIGVSKPEISELHHIPYGNTPEDF